MSPPLISLRNVHKWYGAQHVLRNVSLDVAEGERVVICGPSGSGKSTAISCINGLTRHDRGEIRIAGVPVCERSGTAHDLRRHIGMVFQQFNLFPHLSVLDNCCIAPRRVLGLSRAEAEARAMEELARVGVADQAHKHPDQLSGGQQQRVAIVRALCMRPRILLLDEPTSSLDPEMVGEVLDVMTTLGRAGMTMICVTHEMGFARRVADRIVMMDEGEVVEVAPPGEFFDAGRGNPRVRAFLDRIMRV